MASLIDCNSCCAVMEIDGIQYEDPEYVLKDVCDELQHHIIDSVTYCYKATGEWNAIPGLIMFSGVVGYTNSSKKPKYGQNFKRYLLKHRLGKVSESAVGINKQNHPTHKVKVWIWVPAPSALKRWYAKHKEDVV